MMQEMRQRHKNIIPLIPWCHKLTVASQGQMSALINASYFLSLIKKTMHTQHDAYS